MIEIKQFSFRYENASEFSLKDINLTIKDGDFLGIIGNSGAGKSTLTYAINGVIPHHYTGDFYGEVNVYGMDTIQVRPEELSKFVGSVFQDVDAQIISSIVEDEILYGLENFGIEHSEIEDRIAQSLEKAGISDLRYRTISSLSGGQKQKVAIAAIIALRPKTIVLDEPTGELDPKSSRQIFEMLRELNETYGITIVVVEQKIMLLCEFSKHLLILVDGQMRHLGTVREVLDNNNDLVSLGIHIPRIVSLKNALNHSDLYQGKVPLNIQEAKEMVEEVLV